MYEVIMLEWNDRYEKEIAEVYQMFKDQERKCFDVTFYENGMSVMDCVQDMIENEYVFIVKKDGITAGVFNLDEIQTYKDIIYRCHIHCAIRKRFWGPTAREICRTFRDFLNYNYRIKKLIAEVPQCAYGVIKLLKDMGLKHEGTLKQANLFRDKNGNPKWYDALIYSLTREDL